tara:strand:- start:167 stop:508 length:342 start_codon:yes stop_codon:yes gene_type:complete
MYRTHEEIYGITEEQMNERHAKNELLGQIEQESKVAGSHDRLHQQHLPTWTIQHAQEAYKRSSMVLDLISSVETSPELTEGNKLWIQTHFDQAQQLMEKYSWVATRLDESYKS